VFGGVIRHRVRMAAVYGASRSEKPVQLHAIALVVIPGSSLKYPGCPEVFGEDALPGLNVAHKDKLKRFQYVFCR